MAGQPQMIEPASAAPRGESAQLRTLDWDGRARSYIPGPKLRVSRNLKLHTEEAESIHPVTFEVIRNALMDCKSGAGRHHPQGLLVAGDHVRV